MVLSRHAPVCHDTVARRPCSSHETMPRPCAPSKAARERMVRAEQPPVLCGPAASSHPWALLNLRRPQQPPRLASSSAARPSPRPDMPGGTPAGEGLEGIKSRGREEHLPQARLHLRRPGRVLQPTGLVAPLASAAAAQWFQGASVGSWIKCHGPNAMDVCQAVKPDPPELSSDCAPASSAPSSPLATADLQELQQKLQQYQQQPQQQPLPLQQPPPEPLPQQKQLQRRWRLSPMAGGPVLLRPCCRPKDAVSALVQLMLASRMLGGEEAGPPKGCWPFRPISKRL